MFKVWYLKYLAHCLRVQERQLLLEKAGVEYMLTKNSEDQRRVSAQLTMAEVERSYRVVR